MLLQVRTKDGNQYLIPATQVVVLDDNQVPLACSYVHGKVIVHCDAAHRDWPRVVGELGLQPKPITIVKS